MAGAVVVLQFACATVVVDHGARASTGAPAPGSPEYLARDVANMQAATGRQTAPDGQLNSPEYRAALAAAVAGGSLGGDPFRFGSWGGIRGQYRDVSFTDSSETTPAFAGRIYAPLAGATNPDNGRTLSPPFPGIVIAPGTATNGLAYTWAAEDLAERGYVVLTFTVGGPQGASRYLTALRDAVDFFWSTPSSPLAGGATDQFNPYWTRFDRRPDPRPATPRRRYRFGLAGHSLGAAVASAEANIDTRVSAVVAWDKLLKSYAYLPMAPDESKWTPMVPALGVHSEYWDVPTPYTVGCYPIMGCEAYSPTEGPPPGRELSTGYGGDDGWGIVPPQPGGWVESDVDVMALVLRASTHFEYVDDHYPWHGRNASRYGKAITSYYTTAWLDKYLKHDHEAEQRLAATSFRQLEPKAGGTWGYTPTLIRDEHLSFYFCSGWRYNTLRGDHVERLDPTGAGCSAEHSMARHPGR
jgi:dienelactone hydrolase